MGGIWKMPSILNRLRGCSLMQKGCNSLLLSVHGGDGYLLPILLPEPSYTAVVALVSLLKVTCWSSLLWFLSAYLWIVLIVHCSVQKYLWGRALRFYFLQNNQTSLVKFSAHIEPTGADSLRPNPMSTPKGKLWGVWSEWAARITEKKSSWWNVHHVL